jgi:hypothetical protein
MSMSGEEHRAQREPGSFEPSTGAPPGRTGSTGSTGSTMTEPSDTRRASPGTGSNTVTERPPSHEVVDEPLRAQRDRIRWGAVWAGLVVAIASYIVLQLLFVAVGAIEIGAPQQADAWWTAAAALLAFLLGGITAGASSMWHDVVDGLLHGVVMWAIAVAAVLLLSVLGGGLIMGALDATGVFDQVTVDVDEVAAAVEAEDAQEAASWALLGLGAAWIAAALGAVIGAALWPNTRDVRGPDRQARLKA